LRELVLARHGVWSEDLQHTHSVQQLAARDLYLLFSLSRRCSIRPRVGTLGWAD
jgi:hypothetical protein